MELFFYGAAREVTGSCHCVEVNSKRILVDCGMPQGQDKKEDQDFPFDARGIDYVVVTHAHIDHSGRLPLLVKEGFSGKIFATKITCQLLAIMLRDSAHIQEMEAEFRNRKGKRAGNEEEVPLYTMKDAEKVLDLFVECSYLEHVEIAEGIKIQFVDAGHMLGSCSVEMWLSENGTNKKIVFSGDIGNLHQPIIRDPHYISGADYVVMESTYGDRNHGLAKDYVEELAQIFDETFAKGGNVIIPSFAVGRTQELLYFIREIKEQKLVQSMPNFPVYLDSPLALEATKIFEGDLTGYIDDDMIEIIRNGLRPLEFDHRFTVASAEESKLINENKMPKVIISSSGMCEAGRIRHHLKHNLWRPECTVLFVGYQANGTLGRLILEGAKKVKMFGEEIAVACRVFQLSGLSAHADKDGLLKWVGSFEKKPHVFVVHGEAQVTDGFAHNLSALGFEADAPRFTAAYDLIKGSFAFNGVEPQKEVKDAFSGENYSKAFANLLSAGKRLMDIIWHNKGRANKNLNQFTEQINHLAERWEK